jgi:hypothetical protein
MAGHATRQGTLYRGEAYDARTEWGWEFGSEERLPTLFSGLLTTDYTDGTDGETSRVLIRDIREIRG